MKEPRQTGPDIAAPLICFVMTALAALVLLIAAFVVWLASLVGSAAVAALIAGGFFAVLALVIYLLSVRAAVKRIRERLGVIYEVASRVQRGYAWLSDRFSFLRF